MPDPWLFVSHQATNSGAPRMLLEVMRGMRRYAGASWTCETLLAAAGSRNAGTVIDALARFGRVRTLSSPRAEAGSRLARALDRCLWQRVRLARWRAEWRKAPPDLIYANTITNGRILTALRSLPCPVITHVHELSYSIQRFVRPRELAAVLRCTDHFFAVSHAVVDDLVALGAARQRVTRIPNFLAELPAEPEGEAAKREIGHRLKLPEAAQIVTGCGHIDWLKGTDRFVQLAAACLESTSRPLAFVWVGGEIDRGFAARVQTEVRDRGLSGKVLFVGAVSDPSLFFAASDLVIVPSRVESFSRVALEAGALGRPVIAYAGARGPADLLPAELLVAEPTARAMAQSVTRFLDDTAARENAGAGLRRRIAAEFLAEKWMAKIAAIVAEVRRA